MSYADPEYIKEAQRWLFALEAPTLSQDQADALGAVTCHELRIGSGLVQHAVVHDSYAKAGKSNIDSVFVAVAKELLINHASGQRLSLKQYFCVYILKIEECRDSYHPELPYPALIISLRHLTEKDQMSAWRDLWFDCKEIEEIIKERTMTKQEASKEIASKLEEAVKIIRDCERIADDHGISFDVSISKETSEQTYTPKNRDRLDIYPGAWSQPHGAWDSSGWPEC